MIKYLVDLKAASNSLLLFSGEGIIRKEARSRKGAITIVQIVIKYHNSSRLINFSI
jgi:hypothetical protein